MNVGENLSISAQSESIVDGDVFRVTLYSQSTIAPRSEALALRTETDNAMIVGDESINELLENADVLAAGDTREPSTVDITIPVALDNPERGGSVVVALYYDETPVGEAVVRVRPKEDA